jgi:phage shock protein E
MPLLDVRTPEEFEEMHISSALNLPLNDIHENTAYAQEVLGKIARHDRLGKDTPIKVHCASGGRSAVARQLLTQQGFTNVQNLGGYDEACKCAEERATK